MTLLLLPLSFSESVNGGEAGILYGLFIGRLAVSSAHSVPVSKL